MERLVSTLESLVSGLDSSVSTLESRLKTLVSTGCSTTDWEAQEETAAELEKLAGQASSLGDKVSECEELLCKVAGYVPSLKELTESARKLVEKLDEAREKLQKMCRTVSEDNVASCYAIAREARSSLDRLKDENEWIVDLYNLLSRAKTVRDKLDSITQRLGEVEERAKLGSAGLKSRVKLTLEYTPGGVSIPGVRGSTYRLVLSFDLLDVDAKKLLKDSILACIPGARIAAAKEYLARKYPYFKAKFVDNIDPLSACASCSPESLSELVDCLLSCIYALAFLKTLSDKRFKTPFDTIVDKYVARNPDRFIVFGGDGYKVYSDFYRQVERMTEGLSIPREGVINAEGVAEYTLENNVVKFVDIPTWARLDPLDEIISKKALETYNAFAKSYNEASKKATEAKKIMEQLGVRGVTGKQLEDRLARIIAEGRLKQLEDAIAKLEDAAKWVEQLSGKSREAAPEAPRTGEVVPTMPETSTTQRQVMTWEVQLQESTAGVQQVETGEQAAQASEASRVIQWTGTPQPPQASQRLRRLLL